MLVSSYDIFSKLIGRLKEVKQLSKRVKYGRLYLPSETIGLKVSYLTKEEIKVLIEEYNRLNAIKDFAQYVLNTKNGSRMFNVITKTWNPVTGCIHNCIYCWARKLALTKLKNTKKYKDGFLPKIHPEEFRVKFENGVVFVTDMGDLFNNKVPKEWILKVIKHIEKFPNTYFLFLTKNPERYQEFLSLFPENAILGATIETNKDKLFIKQRISDAPLPSLRYEAMKKLKWKLKFISIEPILDFDLYIFTKWIQEINPFMVYVGYDNYNNKLPEPPLEKTRKLITKLSKFTLVIQKTIRPAWYEKQTITSYFNSRTKKRNRKINTTQYQIF